MAQEINGFEIEQYNVHGIPTGAKMHTCPKCSHTRKKKTDKCMSVNWETGIGNCFHCGELTQLHTFKKEVQEINYVKPQISQPKSDLSPKLIKYLTEVRKLSIHAANALKIREQKEWMPQTKKIENCICFDYYLNDEVINVKYRDGQKNFKLYKGAQKIFYNLDNIRTSKTAVIVEGEFDVMAFATADVFTAVSIPNGFNKSGNINLDYLDSHLEYFDNKDVIYIAVDNDEAGRNGEKELVRRLGPDKCKLVNFEDCKDANEYLATHGKEKLANLLALAKDVKFEGIYTVADAKASMLDGFRNGKTRGTTTYVEELDKAWTWRGGEVNLWTGFQNEGKSLMLNQLCTIRAYWENARVAVFSPENFPLDDFFDDIIEMFIGKSADPYYKSHQMTEEEYQIGMEFCEKNFLLIYPEEDFKLESIFERTKFLIKKNGIRTLIIDPYNTVEHMMKPGEREDLYISRFMARLKRFAVEYDISINLVAHQNTPKINPNDGNRYYKPMLNNIKGGGTFADKADNVLTVWRPNRALDFKDPEVWFASQKIKKQKLVGRPQEITDIEFDIRTNRYLFNGVSPFGKIDRDRLGIPFEEPEETEEKPLPTMSASQAFGEPEEQVIGAAADDIFDEDDEDVPF
jgi:twinkle protein